MQIKELLEHFGRAPVRLDEVLKIIPRQYWQYKPAADKWSIHEQIIHLADAETFGFQRIRKCIAEPGTEFMAFDRDGWAVQTQYHSQSTDEAFQIYKLLRASSYHLLTLYDEDSPVWHRTGIHPERGVQTLEQIVTQFAGHDHTAQIRRTYEAALTAIG